MRIEITEVLDGGLVRFGSPLGTACARWRGGAPGRARASGAGEQILMTAPVAANDGGVVTLRLGGGVVQVERLELYPLNL